ncbi:F-box/FBD/LRR-repeat protein At5g53840-like [Gastrolobium bilobum]|uniref:F-box/FBD/LRR-repeat protein At5g53840-like n=1 Tax=Gastrolobium bilobum TaxID=150636 RepID=UPI002AB1E288|nr:F-box/FBD/LRR-repeat protein At5g53840-like [Gastrolobium bilobum]
MKASVEVEQEGVLGIPAQENNNNSKKKSSIVKQDRLSNLPDEVIHRILSSLDAKTAVQTSVLSKRWRYLWTSLQVLNFHDMSFNDPVLFQLVSEPKVWLGRVFRDGDVSRPPQKVLSILAECVVGKLPQLYACHSLTTLKLADIATETTTFDFVSLKHLYLSDCRFECGVEELLDPFGGCTNLRCLFLHGCQYYGKIESFKIYAPQLTDLSISRMRVDQVFDSDCVIELFTPRLQSFSYRDFRYLYDFSIKVNLPFVEKVDIDLGSFDLSDELNEATNLSLQLIELFEVMGSVKFVSLSRGIIQVLSMFPSLLDGLSSPFTRVRTFELKMDRPSPVSIATNVMAYLFGGSPGFHCY